MKLTIEAGGLKLSNPTILAAGILGTTGASLKRVASMGAGAVVTKSIGIEPKFGHPNPSLVKLECGYINAMGLPNPSYKEFLQELDVAKEAGVPVIASIFGANEARVQRDRGRTARRLRLRIKRKLSPRQRLRDAGRHGPGAGKEYNAVCEKRT